MSSTLNITRFACLFIFSLFSFSLFSQTGTNQCRDCHFTGSIGSNKFEVTKLEEEIRVTVEFDITLPFLNNYGAEINITNNPIYMGYNVYSVGAGDISEEGEHKINDLFKENTPQVIPNLVFKNFEDTEVFSAGAYLYNKVIETSFLIPIECYDDLPSDRLLGDILYVQFYMLNTPFIPQGNIDNMSLLHVLSNFSLEGVDEDEEGISVWDPRGEVVADPLEHLSFVERIDILCHENHNNFRSYSPQYATSNGSSRASTKTINEQDQSTLNLNQATIYPNPIRESSVLEFDLETGANVTSYIVDIHGKVVQSIFQNENKEVGKHQININTDKLSKGMYFCHFYLDNGQRSQTIKLLKMN